MGADLEQLARTARTLSRRSRPFKGKSGRHGLPPLILVTDPGRTPDPVTLAGRLPKGSGVIFRGFGRPGARETARGLASVARERRLILLIGADAIRLRGAGVHLPERMAHRARALKRGRPGLVVTVAAHSLPALVRARRAGADAALLSTVFASLSPSAKAPLGPVRFAALARKAALPVYALGGVKTKNAPRLLGSGAAGLAMVEGLAKALALK